MRDVFFSALETTFWYNTFCSSVTCIKWVSGGISLPISSYIAICGYMNADWIIYLLPRTFVFNCKCWIVELCASCTSWLLLYIKLQWHLFFWLLLGYVNLPHLKSHLVWHRGREEEVMPKVWNPRRLQLDSIQSTMEDLRSSIAMPNHSAGTFQLH